MVLFTSGRLVSRRNSCRAPTESFDTIAKVLQAQIRICKYFGLTMRVCDRFVSALSRSSLGAHCCDFSQRVASCETKRAIEAPPRLSSRRRTLRFSASHAVADRPQVFSWRLEVAAATTMQGAIERLHSGDPSSHWRAPQRRGRRWRAPTCQLAAPPPRVRSRRRRAPHIARSPSSCGRVTRKQLIGARRL